MKHAGKLIALTVTAVMTAAAASGCGTKATPENILRDMSENADKAESLLANFKITMNMGDDMSQVTMDADLDIEATVEPEASHGKGTMAMEISGVDVSTDLETYSVKEGDEIITYTLLDGNWTAESTDEEAFLADVGDMEDYAEYFTLSEDLVTVNGQDCYELTGELYGEQFADMMQGDILGLFSGFGVDEEALKDMAFPCTVCVYREGILPARISFDLSAPIDAVLGDQGVAVSECYVDITMIEYDNVGSITVPDDVIAAAEGGTAWEPDASVSDGDSGTASAAPAEQSAALGDDWESYTVQINDTVVTLPCTIADLEAAGVTMDREYTPEDYVINPEEYELAWFEDANGNELTVDIVNMTSEPMEVKDCLVGGITADAWSVSEGGMTVIFPGGIQIGSPVEDALAAYGEPDSSYNDSEYGDTYMWDEDDSYYNGCDIYTEAGTGVIASIDLECRE